jgi:uncharacterized protein YndB with AHSA1/START domain
MTNLWKIKTIDVNLNRMISGNPAEVFDAWLDPNHAGSPWHGVTRAIVQPHVDGLFYRMHPSESGDFELAHYGRFIVVDRPKRIQYTWVSQHTRGLESVVTVDLKPQGQQTMLTLRHEGVPDDEMGRKHEMGWKHYLDLLAELVGKNQ